MNTKEVLNNINITSNPNELQTIVNAVEKIKNDNQLDKKLLCSPNSDNSPAWHQLLTKMNILPSTSNYSGSATNILKDRYKKRLLELFETKIDHSNEVNIKINSSRDGYCIKDKYLLNSYRGYSSVRHYTSQIKSLISFFDKDEIIKMKFNSYPKAITYKEFVNRFNALSQLVQQ